MFIGRGLQQNQEVPTSSLVFVVNSVKPDLTHEVEIISYMDPNDNIETIFNNILEGKKTRKKTITQQELLENVANWNFIKFNSEILGFIEEYRKNETIDIYRLPELSKPEFGSVFYFDKGLVFAKNKIIEADKLKPHQKFYYLMATNKNKLRLTVTDNVIPEEFIRFPGGSQGIDVYEKKYKIIWRYMNTNKYYYSEDRIMINFNWIIISSNNKQETEYLLSLLNSKCTSLVFNSLLRAENEKDILIGIKIVKQFFRIPRIDSINRPIKNEIIKITEQLMELEEKTLADFVDFSGILVQNFDDVILNGNTLVLCYDDKSIPIKIKGSAEIISTCMAQKFGKGELKLDKYEASLSELRNLQVIDSKEQERLTNYIDDLVFALYFNIPLEDSMFGNAKKVNEACSTNKYYKLLLQ